MIDSLLNLLFRCSHRRLTRPVTPVSQKGVPHGATYVVCLDCGKQFAYDLSAMRIGKPLDNSASHGVLPPGMPGPRRSKLNLALLASALPLGVLAGTLLASKQRRKTDEPDPEKKP